MGTYLKPLAPEDVARIEIPLAEVLPSPAGGVDTGARPPDPPRGIGHHIKFPWSKEIKAVAIIPDFEVATAKARAVLPAEYPRPDVVSIGRISHETRRSWVLTTKADIQPAENSPPPRGTRPVPSGPRPDLPGDAGQAAPAVPPDPYPRADGHCRVHDAKHDARAARGVSLGGGADDPGPGHQQLRGDCREHNIPVQGPEHPVQLEAVGAGRGQPCHPEVASGGIRNGSRFGGSGTRERASGAYLWPCRPRDICLSVCLPQKPGPRWLSIKESEQQPPPPPGDNGARSQSVHVT